LQEIVVFKFNVLDEKIKRDVMEVIWEFSGTHQHKPMVILNQMNQTMAGSFYLILIYLVFKTKHYCFLVVRNYFGRVEERSSTRGEGRRI